MTTLDVASVPSFRQFIAFKLQATGARSKTRLSTLPISSLIMRLVLHLGGFGWLTFAGFTWNIMAGSVVAGISCFALSALLTTKQGETTGRAPDLRSGR